MPNTVLEARVVESYNAGSVRAFSGREYVRSEWRLVPVGYEDEAKQNDLLEVRAYQPEKKILEPVKVKTPAPAKDPVVETEATHVVDDETPVEEKKTRRSRNRSEE